MGTLTSLVQQIGILNQNVVVLNQSMMGLNQNITLLRKELADVEPAPHTDPTVNATLTQLKGLADTLGVTFNPKPNKRPKQ